MNAEGGTHQDVSSAPICGSVEQRNSASCGRHPDGRVRPGSRPTSADLRAFRRVGSAILAISFLAANARTPSPWIRARFLSRMGALRRGNPSSAVDMPAPGSSRSGGFRGSAYVPDPRRFLPATRRRRLHRTQLWTPIPTTHRRPLWIELSITVPEECGYKLSSRGNWFADPVARRFIYDTFGELSLVRSVDAHLERWLVATPFRHLLNCQRSAEIRAHRVDRAFV